MACPEVFVSTWNFPSLLSSMSIHFNYLKHILCFSASFKNQIALSSNSFFVLAGIMKLFMQFASTPSYSSSQNMLFIILPSELHSPKYKYITLGLNKSLLVKKAAFNSYPSLIYMLLYPQIRSSLLKYFAFFNLSITSSIRGSGVLSLIVYWFNFQ